MHTLVAVAIVAAVALVVGAVLRPRADKVVAGAKSEVEKVEKAADDAKKDLK